jgi:hypothetical protein
VVAAVAALVVLLRSGQPRREKEEEKEPLFDIRLVDKKCVPLEEGIKTLPPNVAAAKKLLTEVHLHGEVVYTRCVTVAT